MDVVRRDLLPVGCDDREARGAVDEGRDIPDDGLEEAFEVVGLRRERARRLLDATKVVARPWLAVQTAPTPEVRVSIAPIV